MDFLEWSLIAIGMIALLGFGLVTGYYICLRNHRLIKHEYEMFDKPKKDAKDKQKGNGGGSNVKL